MHFESNPEEGRARGMKAKSKAAGNEHRQHKGNINSYQTHLSTSIMSTTKLVDKHWVLQIWYHFQNCYPPFYKSLEFGTEPDCDIYLGIPRQDVAGLHALFGTPRDGGIIRLILLILKRNYRDAGINHFDVCL